MDKRELTFTSVLIGVLITVVFGAAGGPLTYYMTAVKMVKYTGKVMNDTAAEKGVADA